MPISVDWGNKLVISTSSITDIVDFKDAVRGLEESDVGMLYPPVITYKKVDLGGGAYFHAVDAINGYRLKLPDPGSYEIIGNINMPIVPVAGVFVVQTKAAAFASGTGGGSGPTSEQVAEAVWQHTFAKKLLTIMMFLGLR